MINGAARFDTINSSLRISCFWFLWDLTSGPVFGVWTTLGQPGTATRAGDVGGSGISTPPNGPNPVADFGKYSSRIASPSA
jgi:hypothetical protein